MRLKGEPGPSIDRLLFDTILHDGAPLQYLVDWAGADRVMLESDYPFDMGKYDLCKVVDGLRLPAAERGAVLEGVCWGWVSLFSGEANGPPRPLTGRHSSHAIRNGRKLSKKGSAGDVATNIWSPAFHPSSFTLSASQLFVDRFI